MTIKLDDRNEDWLREHRLWRLRERGWTGTLAEWVEIIERTGEDPIDAGVFNPKEVLP